jgi:hypothetical protein
MSDHDADIRGSPGMAPNLAQSCRKDAFRKNMNIEFLHDSEMMHT